MSMDIATDSTLISINSGVLPGDIATPLIKKDGEVHIGSGLRKIGDEIVVTTPGILKTRGSNQNSFYVHTSTKRYEPKEGDQVVGIIEERGAEWYTVNIFSAIPASLNRLSFKGATKRNKPELKRGDLIYARVTQVQSNGDVELSCISTSGSKKDWNSGETIYGQLPNGLFLKVSTGMAKRLIRPDCAVLNALGNHFIYEVTIGVNGGVWLRSNGGHLDHIIIRNSILNSEFFSDEETEIMVEKLVELAKKSK